MKKSSLIIVILTVSFLLFVILALCGDDPNVSKQTCESAQYEFINSLGSKTSESIGVNKFEYEGHTFIYFQTSYGGNIVHDPNCPCHSIYNDPAYEPLQDLK